MANSLSSNNAGQSISITFDTRPELDLILMGPVETANSAFKTCCWDLNIIVTVNREAGIEILQVKGWSLYYSQRKIWNELGTCERSLCKLVRSLRVIRDGLRKE